MQFILRFILRFIFWIYDASISLGFVCANSRLLILGLENAGKSTLLHQLADHSQGILGPGRHPSSQELTLKGNQFTTFTVGRGQTRGLFENEFPHVCVEAVIFIVDATESARFAEAKSELDKLLCLEELSMAPFLVLGNKVDRHDAVSEDQLRDQLGIDPRVRSIGRPTQLFMCSTATLQGMEDAIRWLSQHRDYGARRLYQQ
jgi:GTP-binding protein SAR1